MRTTICKKDNAQKNAIPSVINDFSKGIVIAKVIAKTNGNT